MSFYWKEELSVGIKAVDDQHKYLVCLINTIEAAANCGLNRKMFLEHLAHLEEYTHFHFDQEEQFQLENKFPHYESNKKGHEKLKEQVAEIIELLKINKSDEVRPKHVGQIFEVLRNWLVDHIVGEDMKMKAFFAK